ncbi:ubiquitin-associated protein 2-like isoform X2 [Limulus polyphemus]|uniref:Ubiquitin-associated protein 2-like isoform X2 n=1 Tax=Limulus polyphemus TaxID=6850 RepID=A0ABM1SZE5_LIMPO|nr:ubiquitin-associated protein 2-like isoform X2 [Limulus polyphemus]
MSSAGPPKGRATKDRGNKPQTPQSQNGKPATEGSKAPDGLNPKIQPTAEQIRIAQIINDANKNEDPDLLLKVEQVMEITKKSKDDAVIALHDCDNDPDKAVALLLEGDQSESKWETTGKKKKHRQVAAQKPAETSVTNNTSPTNNKENRNKGERSRDREPRERDGFRNRGPPRLNRMGGGRNWRNRENEKNERNLEERTSEPNRRPRGGRRGRSRGGNRSRTFQNQKMGGGFGDTFPQSIDTWTNSTAEQAEMGGGGDATMSVGNWSDIAAVEDWSEEDWTESLTETKVFTPSSSSHLLPGVPVDDATSHLTHSLGLAGLQKNNTSGVSLGSQTVLPSSVHSQHVPGVHSSMMGSQLSQSTTQSAPNQFSLSQYAQQATESIKAAQGVGSLNSNSFSSMTSGNSASYPSGYENPPSAPTGPLQTSMNQSAASQPSGQFNGTLNPKPLSHSQPQPIPSRSKAQRVRGPQCSKIPESAVEMPDNSVMSLDVQFGALEFGTDSSPFDFTATSETSSSFSENVISSSLPSHLNSQSALIMQKGGSVPSQSSMGSSTGLNKDSFTLANHSPPGGQTQVNQDLAQNVGQSQKIAGPHSLLLSSQTERNQVRGYPSQRSSQPQLDGTVSNSKEEGSALTNYSSATHQSNHSSSYSGSYVGQNASVLGSSSISTTTANYTHQGSSLASLNSQQILSSTNHQSQGSFSGSQSQNNSHYSSVSTTYNIPQAMYSGTSQTSAGSSFSSQRGYSGQNSSSYPSVNSFSSQQGFSNSATVSTQPASTSLHSSSMSSSKLGTALSHGVKEPVLDSQQPSVQHSYDTAHTTSGNSNLTSTMSTPSTTTATGLASATIGVPTTLGLASTSSVTTTTSILKNSLSANYLAAGKAMPNIPPGVPPAMVGHQYFVGQAGLPFYGLQQPVYSYEDLQILQSRLPTLGYYDMPFQPTTSLTGRDPGLGSVVYTGADGKFSRGDPDGSAVATTLSQGQATTQTHGHPFLNPAALPPGYGYYFPGMMPGSMHQYGAPFIPVPPATNAHGVSTNTQFQKAAAYGSLSYTSAYDSLNQTQDYSKSAYGAGSQGQGKGVTGSSGTGPAADIGASMYNKTHSQLAKTFDKPGFHTGTPPPFNLAGTQNPGLIGASSTPYAPFIPVLTHGQHHSTLLHHHIQQDSPQAGGAPSGGPQRGGPQGLGQQKGPGGTKQNYSYWNPN